MATDGQLFQSFQNGTFGLDHAVFCNIFEYQSCVTQKEGSAQGVVDVGLFGLGSRTTFVCQSDQCVVTSWASGCQSSLQVNQNGQFFTFSSPITLQLGDTLDTNCGRGVFNYDYYNRRLLWCGSAPCSSTSAGNVVQGSTRCSFVTDKSIYSNNGVLLKTPTSSQQSFTVQPGQSVLFPNGQQFICGTKFNQCTLDTDCAAGHTFLYNGLGAEASGGQLQIYGCVSSGTQPTQQQLDYLQGLESQPSSSQFNFGNRCQVKSIQTVQCIPGSATCGSNAVCDPASFTCKQAQQVQCTQDRDCGVGETYDPSTKTFYRFACVANSCQRQATRTVQCAFNYECPQNWYCDIDNTCKQLTAPPVACPFACCQGDPRYFDKPAPPGNVCCPGGQSYAPTLAQCQTGGGGGGNNPPGSATDYLALLFFAAVLVVSSIVVYRKLR